MNGPPSAEEWFRWLPRLLVVCSRDKTPQGAECYRWLLEFRAWHKGKRLSMSEEDARDALR